jgi:hypothetical protein
MGSLVEIETLASLGGRPTAEPRGRLEEGGGEAAFRQISGGDQPGRTTTDDDCSVGLRGDVHAT